MLIKIGKYVDDEHVKCANIDIRCDSDIDNEIIALTNEINLFFGDNKICTLAEFHKDGDAYLYTESKCHIDEFGVTKPFWAIVDKSGIFWNLNAMMKIVNNSDVIL